MDDNKILTLSNGDRIRLKNHCKLLFEVYDLQYASPATISRCGMVYVDAKNLSHEHFFYKWVVQFKEQSLESDEDAYEYILELFVSIVVPMIDFLYKGKTPDG